MELLWLSETLSKMTASMAGSHLEFKEQLSLAETNGHFGDALGCFDLPFQKCDASVDSEVHPER